MPRNGLQITPSDIFTSARIKYSKTIARFLQNRSLMGALEEEIFCNLLRLPTVFTYLDFKNRDPYKLYS